MYLYLVSWFSQLFYNNQYTHNWAPSGTIRSAAKLFWFLDEDF